MTNNKKLEFIAMQTHQDGVKLFLTENNNNNNYYIDLTWEQIKDFKFLKE